MTLFDDADAFTYTFFHQFTKLCATPHFLCMALFADLQVNVISNWKRPISGHKSAVKRLGICDRDRDSFS